VAHRLVLVSVFAAIAFSLLMFSSAGISVATPLVEGEPVGRIGQVLDCQACLIRAGAGGIETLRGTFELSAGSEQGSDDSEWTLVAASGTLDAAGVGVAYVRVLLNGQPGIQIEVAADANSFTFQNVSALAKSLEFSDSGHFEFGVSNYPVNGSVHSGINSIEYQVDTRLLTTGNISLALDPEAAAVTRVDLPPNRLRASRASLIPSNGAIRLAFALTNTGPSLASDVRISARSNDGFELGSLTVGELPVGTREFEFDLQDLSHLSGRVGVIRIEASGREPFAHGSSIFEFANEYSTPSNGRENFLLIAGGFTVAGIGVCLLIPRARSRWN
jgi:hypothetical protein